jgi:hypothetical protein
LCDRTLPQGHCKNVPFVISKLRDEVFVACSSGFETIAFRSGFYDSGTNHYCGDTCNLGYDRMRELNVAQDQVQIMIKQAQHLAKVQRIPYRFVIHENTGVVQWGIAPINRSPIDWTSANQVVGLDEKQTTFRMNKDLNQWFLVLDDDGAIDGQLGRVTLCVKSAPQDESCSTLQKCVIMSTLLGETRRGEWHSKLHDDRFNCY